MATRERPAARRERPEGASAAVEPWRDPGAKPYVRIENVTKRFGDVVAVDGVSLSIYRGELFSLLGGSGSGKSTLLRMLAGFETPDEGRILLDGADVAGIPPYERPVNMMFQSYALFPHMTVAQNVAFGLKQEGLPKSEIRDRVAAMLDLVQMGGYAGRKPHQLSGGQRQRVALARSLVKQPKLLLLDEPLGALDKKLREKTQFELVNIQESVGVTFIVVTHDQEEAMTMSTRIGVMEAGSIAQVGTPAEIYEYPRSRFVADFIGTVNLFEGRVVEDAPDHVLVDSPEAGAVIRVNHAASVPAGTPVWVAVRAEKMSLGREEEGRAPSNRMRGVIQDIAYFGDVSTYHVRLETGKVVRVTTANLVRRAELGLTWDDAVVIDWSPTNGVVLSE